MKNLLIALVVFVVLGFSSSSMAAGDYCPNTDRSLSYYDGTCETSQIITTTLSGEVQGIHAVAGNITDSRYSAELNDAYLFAFTNGITPIKYIQNANLDGFLSRKDMAGMLVNYAIKIRGKTPNTGLVCQFADMNNESAKTKFYATLACQLGMMGVNAHGGISQDFNPHGTVTRAEFGTVLSRMLFDNQFDGGMPYYQKHLDILQSLKIIYNTTSHLSEVRGYAMLMLMRAENQ